MDDENSPHFAINIIQHAYITKKPSEAALSVHIDSKAEDGVKILKELQDPSQTHQYSCSKCVEEIKKHLRRNGIILAFNRHHFNLFMKKYEIKNNEKMCYVYKVHANPVYSYSVFAIEFIVNAIIDDPGILEKLKKDNKKS